MPRRPERTLWRAFWPKALVIVVVVVALAVLERCGIIRRW